MPVRSISVPANMNRGTASKEKDSKEYQAVEPQLPVLKPVVRAKARDAARNAKGMPIPSIIRASTKNAQAKTLINLLTSGST